MMGDKSRVEWTEATWNPMSGCSKVSEGCRNCYAESMAARFGGAGQPYEGLIHYPEPTRHAAGQWNGQVRVSEDAMRTPQRWTRPRRIFVNSMSDLFHEAVSFEDVAKVFGVMAACPQHTFQILTKRPARMQAFFAWLKAKGDAPHPIDKTRIGERMVALMAQFDLVNIEHRFGPWPLPNVWLGVSVEHQAAADERIPLLQEVPAALRWVSVEPLLGPINLAPYTGTLDWVVAGGESGPHARPMHPEWVSGLRDQCRAAAVPFLMKQWGEWAPGTSLDGNFVHALYGGPGFRSRAAGRDTHDFGHGYMAVRIGKKAAGRLMDGRIEDAYPEVR